MSDSRQVRLQDVRSSRNAHPVSAAAIPYPLGTPEYFGYYDMLREANESIAFSYWLHGYKHLARKKVLDVGAGNGYVLSKYAQEGAEVYGIDLTETGIDLCRRRFQLLGLRGNLGIANAEELPFADDTFDCVCSMGVLHHTPDTRRAVDEIFRVLKPGGQLIAMFYHRDSIQYRLKFPLLRLLSGRTIQQQVNEVDGVGNPKGDVYSRSELKRLLNRFQNLEMFAGRLPSVLRFMPSPLLER